MERVISQWTTESCLPISQRGQSQKKIATETKKIKKQKRPDTKRSVTTKSVFQLGWPNEAKLGLDDRTKKANKRGGGKNE